ncbi:MAG: hypothetical protein HY541_04595 [Deltaproteobacteria bacterium]|nr:hypothetical protein [Deltaproteobacteria bacterium]
MAYTFPFNLADVLDEQWIGKKWNDVAPGLKRVDAVSESHGGFDAEIRELVDETVNELEALYEADLDSSEDNGGYGNEEVHRPVR